MMGWRPADVRACSLSDFVAAFEGWSIAQGAEPPLKRADVVEHNALLARYPDAPA